MKEHGQAKQRHYQGSQGGQIRFSDVHPRELQDPMRQVKFSALALSKSHYAMDRPRRGKWGELLLIPKFPTDVRFLDCGAKGASLAVGEGEPSYDGLSRCYMGLDTLPS